MKRKCGLKTCTRTGMVILTNMTVIDVFIYYFKALLFLAPNVLTVCYFFFFHLKHMQVMEGLIKADKFICLSHLGHIGP